MNLVPVEYGQITLKRLHHAGLLSW